ARGIRRDGDDCTLLARGHDAGERTRDVEDAIGVDGKNITPGGIVRLGDNVGGEDASDVAAIVDGTERCFDLGDDGVDGGAVADVKRAGFAPKVSDLRDIEVGRDNAG